MNTNTGYSKKTLDNTNVLLSGGGDKPLSQFIGSISWDSTNRKLKYTPVGGNVTDLVTFGSNAMNSTSYLPLSGDTMTGSITMGKNHYIYGVNETSGSMMHFDGNRTVIGSVGATSTLATHLRSKTGHLTCGTSTTAAYTIWDSGNLDPANYLPLTGGTITSDNFGPLFIQRNHTTNAASLGFKHYSSGTTVEVMGYIGMTAKDGSLIRWNGAASTSYTILDSNNSSVSLSGSKLSVKINGTTKELTNTWRGIQDNLTSSDKTTESLSAKQGYLLANGSARDNTKLPLSGGTMTGTIKWDASNGTTSGSWNLYTENSGLEIFNTIGHSNTGAPHTYSVGLHVGGYYWYQLALNRNDNKLYYRGGNSEGVQNGGWKCLEVTGHTHDYLHSVQISATQTTTAWAKEAAKTNRRALIYNTSGTEWAYLFGFSSASDSSGNVQLGSVLRWGYSDNYIYQLRAYQGNWYSTNWEKIFAGYADDADTVDGCHANSFVFKVPQRNVASSGTAPYNYLWLCRIGNSNAYSGMNLVLRVASRYDTIMYVHLNITANSPAYGTSTIVGYVLGTIYNGYVYYVKTSNDSTVGYDYYDIYIKMFSWNSLDWDITKVSTSGALQIEYKEQLVASLPSGAVSIPEYAPSHVDWSGITNKPGLVQHFGDMALNCNFPDNTNLGGGIYQLHTNYTQTNKPTTYGILADFESVNGHIQFVGYANNLLYFRTYWWTGGSGFTYPEWETIASREWVSSNYIATTNYTSYVMAWLGNAGFGSMNTLAKTYGCASGMTSLDSNTAANNDMSGWTHFINTSFVSGFDTANAWVLQIACPAGTNNLQFRSRSGGTIGDNDDWTGNGVGWTKIIHSGNYSSYALPLTGGTITNSNWGQQLTLCRPGATPSLYFTNNTKSYCIYPDITRTDNLWWIGSDTDNLSHYIIHSGNIGSQYVLSATQLYHNAGGLYVGVVSSTVTNVLQLSCSNNNEMVFGTNASNGQLWFNWRASSIGYTASDYYWGTGNGSATYATHNAGGYRIVGQDDNEVITAGGGHKHITKLYNQTAKTSMKSLPVSYSLVFVTLTASVSASNFSLYDGSMVNGEAITVLVYNNSSSSITIGVPSSLHTGSTVYSLDGNTLTCGAYKFLEISILRYDTNKYILSSKAQ